MNRAVWGLSWVGSVSSCIVFAVRVFCTAFVILVSRWEMFMCLVVGDAVYHRCGSFWMWFFRAQLFGVWLGLDSCGLLFLLGSWWCRFLVCLSFVLFVVSTVFVSGFYFSFLAFRSLACSRGSLLCLDIGEFCDV